MVSYLYQTPGLELTHASWSLCSLPVTSADSGLLQPGTAASENQALNPRFADRALG